MYSKLQPQPLPFQRNIRIRVGEGHFLLSTTPLLVAVHYFKSPQSEPDYTIRFDVSGNPELLTLYHPVHGWDLIGLLDFLWRKIDVFRTLNLRDEGLREQLGLRTVSTPSQKSKRQEKRSMEQAMQMICDHARDNPNCTRLDIARAIGRAKTPYLLTQIELLVQAGTLARTHIVRANGVIEYRYFYAGD